LAGGGGRFVTLGGVFVRIRIAVVAVLCLLGLFPLASADAAVSSPEPFVSWSALVDRQYLDLTGVAATSAQRSAAVAALSAGSKSPGQLVADLRLSDDHVKSVDPVTRLYRAFLLRIPDKGGLVFWIGRRRSGSWSLTRIADSFATSNEFKTRYGKLSNLDFVKLIYDNVLERPYDSGGLNFWTRQLDQKRKTRGAVMANFSESNEYKNKQAAEVTVSVLTVFMLGRAPTKTEFDTAVGALEGGQTTADYATSIFNSTAYANRIAAPLTIAGPTLPVLYAGIPFQSALTATGGFGDQTWSGTGLPGWLTLDPTTGTLSGTPPAAGTTVFTAKVTGGAGMTGSKAITVTVKAGMPDGCVTDGCADLDTASGTIQVPANAVTGVTRNASGTATAVALSAAAPNVAVGKILVIAPGMDTPSGLIVKVTTVTGANGAARTVTVVPSTLTDAYTNGIVSSTGTAEPLQPAQTTSAGTGCGSDIKVEAGPEVDVGLKPHVTVLWGHNILGFGDVFVGTGGVKLFQFQLEGDITYKLKGSMTASVDCKLSVPGARVPIPIGPAGFLFFKLQPDLGLKASAGVEIDTTVKLHCSVMYVYQEGNESRSQYCLPTYTPPKLSTDNTGADLTISGGLTASMTFNEAVGITGNLTASLHAGYHPLDHPLGILDGKVTAKLGLCLACMFDGAAPSLTIADTTVWSHTFHKWDTPSPPPDLTITTTALPAATVGQAYTATLKATGGTKPYTWTATGLPTGLTLNTTTGTITGTPATAGTSAITATVTDGASPTTTTLALTTNAAPSGPPLSQIVAIGGGQFHTCAVLADTTARCWGDNGAGTLGDGTRTARSLPVAVEGLTGVKSISGGEHHTCALMTSGAVWCWGFNRDGEVGDGSTTDRLTPVQVEGVSGATAIATGDLTSCAVLATGAVKCWGYNSWGNLGNPFVTDPYRSVPVTVTGVSDAVGIAIGRESACALHAGGSVTCWGRNNFGQLGGGTTDASVASATVLGVTNAVAISSGQSHSCALLSSGIVKCWGRGTWGVLGDGFDVDRATPVVVSGIGDGAAVSGGQSGTCAAMTDGTAKCWGYNSVGQLGDGTATNRLTPAEVATISNATSVTVGSFHSCALLADGTARCWGGNDLGMLGDGTTTNSPLPVAVRTS
jgi:alpha-tubulin suppressor-like RCC1 family protein